MSDDMDINKIIPLILYAIALAMGVAIFVLPLVGQTVDISLAGVGLFCVALAGLIKASK
ncbi:MAG: hypothetical protein ACW99U_09740 [Candidatus Thorarchaeota archaeon]